MGSIDRDLQRIFDAERDAARTPAGLVDVVARRVGRRRGSVIAGMAGAGLAVAGLVATLGVTLARNTEPITTPDQPIEVRTYLGMVGWQVEGAMRLVDYCGEAAPQAKPISEYFTLSSNVESLVDDLSTDVTFYTDGGFGTTGKQDILNISSRVDAASGLMQGWLFVQDGLVVGYVDNVTPDESLSTGFRAWEEGGSTSLSTNTVVAVSCEAGSMVGSTHVYDMSPSTILPVGDYEAYPVVQIDTSPKLDAFRTLASQGISTSSVWEGGLSEPGSWDCRQAAESTGLTPAKCVEGLYEDASGIATVTVPPELQSPDIHVTLIGVPIPYSRTGAIVLQAPEAWPWSDNEPGFDGCTPEQTEAFWIPEYSYGDVMLNGAAVLNPLLTNSGLTASVEILGQSTDDGTLSGIVDFDVLLSSTAEEYWNNAVTVGFARATLNDGGTINLDRYAGPTTVTLTLGDVTWCGQPPPQGVKFSATILGSATFAPKDGDEREVKVNLWVAPNGLPYN